jgi:polyferredoxin
MVGQAILAIVFLLLFLRILGWIAQGVPLLGFLGSANGLFYGLLSGWRLLGVELNYYHAVDIFLAGIVGVGFYFWFSGRVWCRFACPLAALMHIYTRFSRYRIFPEKSKCISCNVCTTVCHQGIDVMNFANKGLPMEDPQCVRCSACVTECPTGVLAFGRYGTGGEIVLDRIGASPVRMREQAQPE